MPPRTQHLVETRGECPPHCNRWALAASRLSGAPDSRRRRWREKSRSAGNIPNRKMDDSHASNRGDRRGRGPLDGSPRDEPRRVAPRTARCAASVDLARALPAATHRAGAPSRLAAAGSTRRDRPVPACASRPLTGYARSVYFVQVHNIGSRPLTRRDPVKPRQFFFCRRTLPTRSGVGSVTSPLPDAIRNRVGVIGGVLADVQPPLAARGVRGSVRAEVLP